MMAKKKFSRNKQEKIHLIYKTFFDLVLKQGYHNTSTNHVSESANISVGTIYRYFPNGKEDIIKKYFEESMKNFLDEQGLIKINQDNIRESLHHFVIELVKNHRENQGYNLAFRSAIQSDKKLQELHKDKVFNFFKKTVTNLRKMNENFQQFPEKKLTEVFVFTYNLVNAIIYHHLSVMELFSTDDEFIEYLTNIVAFSLQYLLKS